MRSIAAYYFWCCLQALSAAIGWGSAGVERAVELLLQLFLAAFQRLGRSESSVSALARVKPLQQAFGSIEPAEQHACS